MVNDNILAMRRPQNDVSFEFETCLKLTLFSIVSQGQNFARLYNKKRKINMSFNYRN